MGLVDQITSKGHIRNARACFTPSRSVTKFDQKTPLGAPYRVVQLIDQGPLHDWSLAGHRLLTGAKLKIPCSLLIGDRGITEDLEAAMMANLGLHP